MEVSNAVQGGPRHGDRIAAALADVVVGERHGPWSIISANTGESGHARENHRPRRSRLVEVLAPDPSGAAVASFKDDRRTARAPALYVQPAATPNVDEAREVTLRGVGHWRGGARGAQGDGEQEDGDGQGGGCMTKLKRTHDQLPWLPMMRRVSRNLPHRGQDACELDDVENGGKLLSFRL